MTDRHAGTIALTVIACAILLLMWTFVFPGSVWGATYFKFTYPSEDGVTGRYIVTDEASGDSIAGGALTETERATLTYWKGSATLNPGSYTVEGFIFAGSDTSIGSYRVDVYPRALAMFFGACDGCYQRLYPEGGTANKDSAIIIDPSLGNDSLVGKVVFYHGTTPSVYDSAYFYYDEPW